MFALRACSTQPALFFCSAGKLLLQFLLLNFLIVLAFLGRSINQLFDIGKRLVSIQQVNMTNGSIGEHLGCSLQPVTS